MDIAAIVLGSLGFVLSLCIAIFEILHRRRRLKFYIGSLDIFSVKDNVAIVILHACFLNPSNEGKTVVHIGLNQPKEIKVLDFVKRYQPGENIVICQLPNYDIEDLKLSRDELLETPLDIPPLQSLRKLYPQYVEWDSSLESEYRIISPSFVPFLEDMNDKRIYGKPFEISIEHLKSGGLFYLL